VTSSAFFDDSHEEAAAGRLRRAILVDEIAAALGAISIALLYLFLVQNLWLLALVVPVGGLSVALRLVRRSIDRGDTSKAVTVHAVGNWVVGVSVTFVVPFIWPVMMLTALMPLVLAVPYVRRKQLITLIAASVVTVVWVSLLGLTQMATGITDEVSPWIRNTVVISALAAVFVIIVVIVWQAYAQNEAILLRVLATNTELARSEEQLARQAELLRDSRARLASVADKERRRIERDLHDGAQQRLVGLAVRLGLLRSQLDDSHADTVDAMKDEINSAIEELRELAHGIYPPLLAQEGLTAALRAAARRSPLPTRISADQVERYTPDIENALYFCGLEALQNAAKHAGGQRQQHRAADHRRRSRVPEQHGRVGWRAAQHERQGRRGRRDRGDRPPRPGRSRGERHRADRRSRRLMIRLVIVEDDLLVREGLTSLFGHIDNIEVVAACADVEALEAALANAEPDVVLTDIRMPPTHTDEGIRAAVHIHRTRPGVGVVVLSQFAEPEYVVALLDDGSDGLGYLLKERVSDIDHLTRAIESVARGESAIDPKIIDVLISSRSRGASDIDRLTSREAQVLSLIAEGMNNATIAEQIVVTDKAVQKHINSIFSKLGLGEDTDVHRRVKAVLMWLAQD